MRDLVARIVLTTRDLASRPLRRFRERMSGLRGAVIQLGAAITAYLSIRTVTQFFTGAVREAAGFETALARVRAVSQATDADMARLKAAATEMGAATTFNANQAAAAMETLARAGLDTEETLAALPEVLALARGNSIELAEAASLVTQAAKGMGIGFEESGRVADVLTRAAQRANTNVTGLGQALSYAAPTARSLGLELEETAALVGQLANAGIDASRAGTALNAIFSQFSDPASTFRGELASLGITTDDFGEALVALEASGERGEAAILALGREAGPSMRALLSQGTAALGAMQDELYAAAGASQAAADTMDDNLDGALDRLASAWRTLKRAIGERVLEPAKEGIDELATGVREFVTGGRLERLGTAFRETFEAGVKGVRDFLHTFDLDAATERASQAMEGVGEVFARTAAGMRAAGQYIAAVWHGVNVAVGAVMHLIGDAIVSVGRAFQGVTWVLNKLGIVTDGFAKRVRTQIGAIDAANEAIQDHVDNSLAKMIGATVSASDALLEAAGGQRKATEATEADTRATEENAEARKRALGLTTEAKFAVAELQAQHRASAKATESGTSALAEARREYERLRASGTASLQEVGDALQRVHDAQRDVSTGTQGLGDAYETLGIKSQATLEAAAEQAEAAFTTISQQGEASQVETARAFAAYAEAVRATGDTARIATLDAQEQALNYSGVLDTLGARGAAAGAAVAAGMDKAAERTEAAGETAERTTAAVREGVGGFSQGLSEMLGGVSEVLSGASQTVQELWQSTIEGAARAGRSVRRYMAEVGAASERLTTEYHSQQAELEELMARVDQAGASTEELSWIASLSARRFSSLGAEQLAPLRQAISDANRRLEALRSSAEGTLQGLQDELLRLQGREDELAARRQERRREELRGQLTEAQAAGDSQAIADLNQAMRTLERIGTEQARQRTAERERAQREASERKRTEEQRRVEEQRRRREEQERARRAEKPARREPERTVRLELGTSAIDVPEHQAEAFLAELERVGQRSS